jgi:hypothetical protein
MPICRALLDPRETQLLIAMQKVVGTPALDATIGGDVWEARTRIVEPDPA